MLSKSDHTHTWVLLDLILPTRLLEVYHNVMYHSGFLALPSVHASTFNEHGRNYAHRVQKHSGIYAGPRRGATA